MTVKALATIPYLAYATQSRIAKEYTCSEAILSLRIKCNWFYGSNRPAVFYVALVGPANSSFGDHYQEFSAVELTAYPMPIEVVIVHTFAIDDALTVGFYSLAAGALEPGAGDMSAFNNIEILKET